MAAILDYYSDQSIQALSGNWALYSFGNVMDAQLITSDETTGGEDLHLSWNGGDTHFKIKPGETFNQDEHRRNKAYLRIGTGAYDAGYSISGMDFRISAWSNGR